MSKVIMVPSSPSGLLISSTWVNIEEFLGISEGFSSPRIRGKTLP